MLRGVDLGADFGEYMGSYITVNCLNYMQLTYNPQNLNPYLSMYSICEIF